MDGLSLPILKTAIPGPRSQALITDLAETECSAITARRARRAEHGGVSQDPIVWEAALGANVMDVDENVYVDLTSAFGVASVGHAHPEVMQRAGEQASRLPHAMGDMYPGRVKIELAKRLAALAPGDLAVSIFGMAGFEAVEAALKTAAVASQKPRVLAFSGSYHGLGYGALSVTAYRREFRAPFRGQLGRIGIHLPYANCYRCPLGLTYPDCGVACLDLVRHALDDPASGIDDVGAVLVEPIQGRGGVIVPPDEWLQGLVALCGERGILVIFDEIYTGMGRTGRWFASEHAQVVPDLMCLGKALAGGFPLSVAMGTRDVMARWGLSAGEAVHTSTFLGNPMGCAMALAVLEVMERDELMARGARAGARLRAGVDRLAERFAAIGDVRGRGALIGVELVEDRTSKAPASRLALQLVRVLLERGYLVMPSAAAGNVLSLLPPFVITDEQIDTFLLALEEALCDCGAS